MCIFLKYYNSSEWQIQHHNNKDNDSWEWLSETLTAVLHCTYNIGDMGM